MSAARVHLLVVDRRGAPMNAERLARGAVLDVYSLRTIHGAPEWAESGDLSTLPRRLRTVVSLAAERIERRMLELVS